MKKNFYCIIRFLLVFTFTMSCLTTFTKADELDDVNKQKDQKESEKDQKEDDLFDVNYSITSTSEAISLVSTRIADIEKDVSDAKEEEKAIRQEIESLETELSGTSNQYEKDYLEYSSIVSDIYKASSENKNDFLYVLMDFDTLEDAVYYSEIQTSLYESLTSLGQKLRDIQDKKVQVDADYKKIEETEDELALLQIDLGVQRSQLQILLNSQSAARTQVLNELKELDSEIASLDAEAQRIIASKYPGDNPGGGGGGVGVKPVGSEAGYFLVTVKDAGNNIKVERYVQGPVKVNSVSPLGVNGMYIFKGTLEARADTDVYLINELPVEQYIKGLGEMPSSWGINGLEALKVQAVAGRSYAIKNFNKRVHMNYNLVDSVSDQYYIGYSKETSSYGAYWAQAVDQTVGKVATYNGNIIPTYYSSSAAGHTLDNCEVWHVGENNCTPLPYTVSVSDWTDPANGKSYDTVGGSQYTYKNWRYSNDPPITESLLEDIINYGLGSSISDKVGTITSLQHVYNTGGSTITNNTKRTTKLIITGTTGTYTMNADNFRIAYNVKAPGHLAIWSKLWDVTYASGQWKFYSRGYGHKVGMSQYGAYGRALSGQSFEQILTHYYQNTSVSTVNTNYNIRIGLTKVPSAFYIQPTGNTTITSSSDTSISAENGDVIFIVEQ